MRKLIAITQVTLDGVMQAPGGPEEDPVRREKLAAEGESLRSSGRS